jgi:hypothetical protein
VVCEVSEDVAQRVRDPRAGAQHVGVEGAPQTRCPALDHAIEHARHTDREPLHSARERFVSHSRRHQVHVIACTK